VASSDEGYSYRDVGLPVELRGAWNSTVKIGTVEGLSGRHGGTGVIIGFDSVKDRVLIVTAQHVVERRLSVSFENGQEENQKTTEDVKILLEDVGRDIALISAKVPGEVAVSVMPLADSSKFYPGLPVYAIGHPATYKRKTWSSGKEPQDNSARLMKRYSIGFVNVTHKYYPFERERGLLVVHNADILPGSSGGPVVDAGGSLVGINTRIVYNESFGRKGIMEPIENKQPVDPTYPYCDGSKCWYFATGVDEVKKLVEKVVF
jgi:S1-C subfamily serine protease